ncbi:hypothetical protein AVEN_272303-1 [Araneus ventricosus]|uniref:Uncharacterized protein n=1 Tax=Araneus ventricosus TaxID=182803 RepID=A0A4Y2RAT4_ARAVE|nr:hypothetical protein AVEN_272303-1 [Araneus ventricosus]
MIHYACARDFSQVINTTCINLGSHLCYITMASAVLDFEGFQLFPGRFVVKELAVCAVNDDTFCGRWMFKSPHSFESLDRKKQNTYSWITKFLHHIDWEDGELPYDTFHCVLTVIFEAFPYI